ncbi:hypothetical protein MRS44_002006 [Fusarium solani]|uniref:uncharacterized protein n=1 Tax=Fusarium solani TaxID=169388 RepID=UPI0032C406D7|nr:hypothetical protein MRS44_002006 [Fusarium solani]
MLASHEQHQAALESSQILFQPPLLGLVFNGTSISRTANQADRVKDLNTTQNQLISVARELDASGEWKTEHANTASDEKEALASLAIGQTDEGVILKLLFRAVYGEGYGGRIENDDNELLGVEGLNTKGLKAVLKAAM